MSATEHVYVTLVDELVDVQRPMHAERDENLYRIIDQPYDREIEKWEFEAGDIVLCEPRDDCSLGRILVAVALHERRPSQ